VRPLTSVAPVLAVALLGACGVVGGSEPDPTTPTPAASTPAPPSSAPEPDPGEVEGTPTVGADLPPGLREEPQVQKAIADAARRLGVPESQIDIAAWSAVTWDDGSMGCPVPGRAYTQATVDGWLLLLRTDVTLSAYHAGPDGVLRYCRNPEGTYTVRPS
jgi:hypothetical protein